MINGLKAGDIIKLTKDERLLRNSNLPDYCGGWIVEIINVEIVRNERNGQSCKFSYIHGNWKGTYYCYSNAIERKF